MLFLVSLFSKKVLKRVILLLMFPKIIFSGRKKEGIRKWQSLKNSRHTKKLLETMMQTSKIVDALLSYLDELHCQRKADFFSTYLTSKKNWNLQPTYSLANCSSRRNNRKYKGRKRGLHMHSFISTRCWAKDWHFLKWW